MSISSLENVLPGGGVHSFSTFNLEVKVEMGGQIVDTTGNFQMELAFDTFSVRGTKK
jgi:hypothetical protein